MPTVPPMPPDSLWQFYWWKAEPPTPLPTREAWAEYMRPLIFYRGMAARDLVIHEDGPRVVWESGRMEVASRQESLVCILGKDPRYEYDMNRQPVAVRPEYRGEAEKWGDPT